MNITVQNQSRAGCVSKGDKYSPNSLWYQWLGNITQGYLLNVRCRCKSRIKPLLEPTSTEEWGVIGVRTNIRHPSNETSHPQRRQL